jgi:ribosome biogenesis SPOUT family RNA methylase Rps3
MVIYIIEHLDPRIWKWNYLEYKHISEIVGKDNLWFTNIKRENKKLEKLGKCFKQSVKEMKLNNACVLDPDSKQTLVPNDSKNFEYFIFGGIMGDYPPRKRTKEELTQFVPDMQTRNIGKKQFSTDNAVFVVKRIIEGEKLENMKFQNKITIKTGEFESVDLPFCYPIVNGKPFMSDELLKFIKNKKGF